MMRNTQPTSTRNRGHRPTSETSSPDAVDLKNLVRDAMLLMRPDERTEFIQALEIEMQSANHSIRQYLIPLGISARTPGEMTPTEVDHLVRYLMINIPGITPAVERAMARFGILAEGARATDHFLAA